MYYLGLDYGGTQVKAALYSRDGAELWRAVRPTLVETPAPRIVEIDMQSLWQSVCACIGELLQRANICSRDVLGLSVCSHGKGLYLLDGEGRPCGKGILSADTRAIPLLQSWRQRGLNRALYPHILQDIWPSHPLALLGYLQQWQPQLLQRTQYICMGHDYLRYCLTGKIAAERSNISGSALVDVRSGTYSVEVLQQTNLYHLKEKLPPIIDSSALAGYVNLEAAQATGLQQGTPVYGGFFDVVGAAVASGLRSENDYHAIMGTWSISTCLSSCIVEETSGIPGIPWGQYGALPGMYFVHDGSPSSAGNLHWFLQQFLRQEPDFCYNNKVLQRLSPSSNQLFFYPYLYASNLGEQSPGSLIGLQGQHRYDDVLYAVYEGILFSHMVHLEKLKAVQAQPQHLLLTGGPSRSRPWMQMFADCTLLPVLTLAGVEESGCKAAALAAAVGSGHFANFIAAMDAWVVYNEALQPKHSPLWAAKYQRYLEIGRHIAALY